jgi:beta-glucanase (GH16 family)
MRSTPLAGVALVAALAGCSSGGASATTPAQDGGDASTPGIDATSDMGTGATDATTDGGAGDAGAVDAPDEADLPGWTLTWSDEFDGPDGSAVDPAKWTHDVGGTGWGNQEREYYTDGSQNAVQQGGDLVVTATPDGAAQYTCWYGACLYTSARLKTQGLFAQQYGRFETRARLPSGQGLWPAVWMLGSNIDTVSWPACGEIDFLETVGTDITENHGSLHAPSFNPTATYTLPNGAKLSDAFHTFAIEWAPDTIAFYVDDNLYETRTPADLGDGGGTWEFEHPFFLIVNVAVGGTWPGDPDSTTTFPQTLQVDWIRVYEKSGSDL